MAYEDDNDATREIDCRMRPIIELGTTDDGHVGIKIKDVNRTYKISPQAARAMAEQLKLLAQLAEAPDDYDVHGRTW